MRILRIIVTWLLMCVIYSLIAALALAAGLFVSRFFGHKSVVLSYRMIFTVIVFVGVIGASPGLTIDIRKYWSQRINP
jgi:hypothetical protein